MFYKSKYQEYILLLGNGFALNVYLPSLLAIDCKKILIPSSARKFLSDDFNQYIEYIDDKDIVNYKFLKIIIAEPPNKQYRLICDKELWKNSNNFILEKPIAENYKKAQYLMNILYKNKKNYSINYSFRYTKWFADIYKLIHNNQDKGEMDLTWRFKGRHLAKKKPSWKNNNSQGGGVIKYYGIHLIAILSDIGYSSINKSTISKKSNIGLTSWSSEFFSDTNLPKLNLLIDSYSNENIFCLQQINQTLLEIESPFSLESIKYMGDNRIPPTIKFLREKTSDLLNHKNMKALELWSKIESIT